VTWLAIGARAGVDFPYLAWRLSQALPVAPLRASPGVRWVRLATDIPSAWGAWRDGELTPLGWARSLRAPRQGALAATDDPLPAIADPALVAWRTVRRAGSGSGRELVHRLCRARDLLIGDTGVHRQRDDPLGEFLANREWLAAGDAIRRRVVDGYRIVDRGVDPAPGEVGA
jgi:hypothetical protein